MLRASRPLDPGAAARSAELADRLRFDLTEELGYRYPDFSGGSDPAIRQLAEVCRHAFDDRYAGANGLKAKARIRLDEELRLIDELGLAGFFLLHWEVLELARVRAPSTRSRLAAALPAARPRPRRLGRLDRLLPDGISHVDPVASELSLGRFLNKELESVPDIDLDFPRDIREKLIVRVTERYGREHAALVASFATYRSRGAIRDVGKALGLPFAELERLARVSDGWNAKRVGEELAMLPDAERKLLSPRWRAFAELTAEIAGLPRHVSQHPGGMVISTRPLVRLRPGAARGNGRPAWPLPVGQGLVLGCRLPQDRPARARHAVGGRGLRRTGRGALRRADRPLAHPARRPRSVRRHPARRHGRRLPDRAARSRWRACSCRGRRTSTT